MTKQDLRTKIKHARALLSADVWREKSTAIAQRILTSNAYREAPCIFTYISVHGEVNTLALIDTAWADGKMVAVPVTEAQGQMHFSLLTPETPLVQTRFGTIEPQFDPQKTQVDNTHPRIPTEQDLFLVPGLAFDKKGNRLGYGGGFYDRYLSRYPSVRPIALAFALQLSVTTLEPAPHDIPMSEIFTEEAHFICSPK